MIEMLPYSFSNPFRKTSPVIAGPIAATLLITLLLTASGAAFGANPHFIKGPTVEDKTISGDTAALTISFKAAGLGNEPVNVFLTASNAIIDTECTNRGGNTPPGQAETGAIEGPTQTIQSRNGQITATSTLSATVTAEQAGCPDKMQPAITSALFEDVTLHIQNAAGEDILTANLGDIDV